jgi:hypothetical protein
MTILSPYIWTNKLSTSLVNLFRFWRTVQFDPQYEYSTRSSSQVGIPVSRTRLVSNYKQVRVWVEEWAVLAATLNFPERVSYRTSAANFVCTSIIFTLQSSTSHVGVFRNVHFPVQPRRGSAVPPLLTTGTDESLSLSDKIVSRNWFKYWFNWNDFTKLHDHHKSKNVHADDRIKTLGGSGAHWMWGFWGLCVYTVDVDDSSE